MYQYHYCALIELAIAVGMGFEMGTEDAVNNHQFTLEINTGDVGSMAIVDDGALQLTKDGTTFLSYKDQSAGRQLFIEFLAVLM